MHPGMSVSDLQLLAPEGSGDSAIEALRIFGFANAPGFDPAQLIELERAGVEGGVPGSRAFALTALPRLSMR